jgi:hypothetical protein
MASRAAGLLAELPAVPGDGRLHAPEAEHFTLCADSSDVVYWPRSLSDVDRLRVRKGSMMCVSERKAPERQG